MKPLIGLIALLMLAGCSGKSADEAEAAQALAPKPMTAEQKAALEKVKGSVPQPAAAHAGAGN